MSEPGNGANAAAAADSAARVVKRSVVIAGHRTSISLEDIFWNEIKAIAAQANRSTASLIAEIDETRGEANLSSAIRVYVLRKALARHTESERQPSN
ncbi:MAG: ribbon-helix-helix domain-containing protein [Beijerinckiaceae bacterium]